MKLETLPPFIKRTLKNARQANIIWLLSIVFWVALWLSLQAGDFSDISRSGSLYDQLNSLRTIIPLATIVPALVIILYRWRKVQTFTWFSPIGLTVLYGSVGLIAAVRSPEESSSMYWALAYLSVPLVLWVVMSNPRPLMRATHILNLNWFIIIVGVAVLFIFGLLKMDLSTVFVKPYFLFECHPIGPWQIETSGVLRSTGVGRYSAISALIALSLVCRGEHRLLWGLVLTGSLILLLTSGARTSMVGLAVAAPLILSMYEFKRTLLYGAALLVVLAMISFSTGIYDGFIEGCVNKYSTPTRIPDPVFPATSSDIHGFENTQVPIAPSANQQAAIPHPTNQQATIPHPTNQALAYDVISSTASVGLITGRTEVWKTGFTLFKQSPVVGYGFHADRIILDDHMHNALMHSLVQTGILGTLPFVIALLLAWKMFIKGYLTRMCLTKCHRNILIQIGGILAFLSVRGTMESTGAFFGVDWLILAPILLYLQLVNTAEGRKQVPNEQFK